MNCTCLCPNLWSFIWLCKGSSNQGVDLRPSDEPWSNLLPLCSGHFQQDFGRCCQIFGWSQRQIPCLLVSLLWKHSWHVDGDPCSPCQQTLLWGRSEQQSHLWIQCLGSFLEAVLAGSCPPEHTGDGREHDLLLVFWALWVEPDSSVHLLFDKHWSTPISVCPESCWISLFFVWVKCCGSKLATCGCQQPLSSVWTMHQLTSFWCLFFFFLSFFVLF